MKLSLQEQYKQETGLDSMQNLIQFSGFKFTSKYTKWLQARLNKVEAQNSTSTNKSSFKFPGLEEAFEVYDKEHPGRGFARSVDYALKRMYNFIVGNKKR